MPQSVPEPVADREPLVERALGAFLGAAVGDALGAPFEFGPPGQYSARFPRAADVVADDGRPNEMTGGGGFAWRPGEFTDDTQMAVALAESLTTSRAGSPAGAPAANGHIDADDLWLRWRVWASDASDVGVITRSALRHPHWQDAAATAHRSLGRSAGNGSLMRVTPVALAFARPDADVDVDATGACMATAVEQSALTHHDPAAGWGAAIGAELIRRTVLGDDPIAAVDEVVGLVPEAYRDRYRQMLHPDWAPGAQPDEPGNGSVWGCLAQAVWAVRHHGSFHDAVTAAIDLGDDTDTVACVTGALAGARSGIAGIPARWLTVVHGSVRTPSGLVRYDRAALERLALALVGA